MATKESAGEKHYEVLCGSLGSGKPFGPFSKGDIVAGSELGSEVERLLNTSPPSIKLATREVPVVDHAAPDA